MTAPAEEFEVTVELGLDDADSAEELASLAAKKLRCSVEDLPQLSLRKRSIDARHGRIKFLLVLGPKPQNHVLALPAPREVDPKGARVLIVGGGPAGLFCAYELARAGIACTVIERGKQVQARRRDLASLQTKGILDDDSNYCFGEGGAGTYSDGKLYTRSHKRGNTRDVLEILTKYGAPENILVEARPHIGSNKLPKVVTAMRESLEAVGVEFVYDTKVVGLLKTSDGKRCSGVVLENGETLEGAATVIATGHSARGVYDFLIEADVKVEAKSFALGVRVEHPQPLINQIQYGKNEGHEKLPAASYRVAHTVEERGVFSFCMCPGGWIVPASTEENHLVVNGMSLSKRDSPFANSGIVVGVQPEDWAAAGFDPVVGGLALQRAVEASAFEAGGGKMQAPATRVTDYLEMRPSSSTPKTSYKPGLSGVDIAEVLAASRLPLADKIRVALRQFETRLRGYVTEEAVLVGVESRTSSPLRVLRDKRTFESPSLQGLYPCGEGAGYAGGIVSAAVDGISVARAANAAIAT